MTERLQALPRWAAHLAVPPDEHIAALCTAYDDCQRPRERKPAAAAASSASESGAAEHEGQSSSVAADWKRILDGWDR